MQAKSNLAARRSAVNLTEALTRAISGQSVANYAQIYRGFAARGIPESEIKPRENVFTYDAWKALGRQVRRGEHGVSVFTFIECSKKDEKTGEEKTYRRPWRTRVFHISQTDPVLEKAAYCQKCADYFPTPHVHTEDGGAQ